MELTFCPKPIFPLLPLITPIFSQDGIFSIIYNTFFWGTNAVPGLCLSRLTNWCSPPVTHHSHDHAMRPLTWLFIPLLSVANPAARLSTRGLILKTTRGPDTSKIRSKVLRWPSETPHTWPGSPSNLILYSSPLCQQEPRVPRTHTCSVSLMTWCPTPEVSP